jgi:hypothetical protein
MRGTVTALREEIARAYADLQQLLHATRPHLLARYQTLLGPSELEVLTLECRVNRLRRKLSLLHAAWNRNERPDLAAIEQKLGVEQAQWQARINAAARDIDEAQKLLGVEVSEKDAKEFRSLFKALVVALHPDLHPAQDEDDRVLWHRVLAAYESGDLEAMRTLSSLACGSKVGAGGLDETNALELLDKECERLRRQLRSLVDRISALQREPPFNLAEYLDDSEWVDERRAEAAAKSTLLREQEQHLEREIQRVTQGQTHGSGFGPN